MATSRREDCIEVKDLLSGRSDRYQVERFLGHGAFGKVARCKNVETKEKVAVKIVPKEKLKSCRDEVAVLEKLRQLDPEKNNLVRFAKHFEHKGHSCLVFEMLDMNLHELVRRHQQPLGLSGIRTITHQMLAALKDLSSIGVVHADIKPDNIMLVDHRQQPFRVKLIDFGLACQASSMPRGMLIQAPAYRAPEVILGTQLNEAVDMWALGCVVAFMYLGQNLYPILCQYELMRAIVRLQGQPEDHLLDSGMRTRNYFIKDKPSPDPSWRLREPEEYYPKGPLPKRTSGIYRSFTSLDDVTKAHPEAKSSAEDTRAFLDLFRQMLHLNPERRITPIEALGHPCITMDHLWDSDHKPSIIKESQATDRKTALGSKDEPAAKEDEATAAGTGRRPAPRRKSAYRVSLAHKFKN